MKTKLCKICSSQFLITGRNHVMCSICAKTKAKEAISNWQAKHRTKLPGVGKGGYPHTETANGAYKHGQCVFRRWAKEKLKELSYCCERCGNKIDVSVRGTWAGHHKDHNRLNNTKDNLEVLCKRCHQIEHECWTHLQSVTTILKGSTPETVEAHSPEASGDDIVCSA